LEIVHLGFQSGSIPCGEDANFIQANNGGEPYYDGGVSCQAVIAEGELDLYLFSIVKEWRVVGDCYVGGQFVNSSYTNCLIAVLFEIDIFCNQLWG
jgi:hypothetical protein